MLKELLSLIYPPSCLHCKSSDCSITKMLCKHCAFDLELLQKKECCSLCFKPLNNYESTLCSACHKTKSFPKIICAFDSFGPALAMRNEMHHTPRKMLAKTLAAFLILQYFTVEKTPPDLIIPMPEPWINKLGKKESVNTLIAKEMSRIQNIDMLKAFKCPHYFSKHQLRMYLKLNSSFTKHGKKLVDKRVILIADVIHSKEPFTKASQLLSGFFPSSIIGMGLVHLPNAKGA